MSNPNQKRDNHGRFKPDHRTRNLAIGAAAVVGVGAVAVVGALRSGLLDRYFPAIEGHDAPDLALDTATAGVERGFTETARVEELQPAA